MARDMISTNEDFFKNLEVYCTHRAPELRLTPGIRYLEGDNENDKIIKHLSVLKSLSFGSHKNISHLTYNDDEYIALVGFNNVDLYLNALQVFGEHLIEVELSSGYALVILHELQVKPLGAPEDIYDYLEADSKNNPLYEGHGYSQLLNFFPRIVLLQKRNQELTFMQLAAMLSVAESSFGSGWISESLMDELIPLAGEFEEPFPLESISRSVFDPDPRNLFLALYRCIEATYAKRKSEDLLRSLGVSTPWTEIAKILSDELKWRPRELSSLETVLAGAIAADIRSILIALDKPESTDPVTAAKAIYKLRNQIVHFDSSRSNVEIDNYDWNAVCMGMVGAVYHIYDNAFGLTV